MSRVSNDNPFYLNIVALTNSLNTMRFPVIEFTGRKGGFGKTIIVNHGFGYKTLYAHLNKYKVKKGQKIKRGDLIGLTGSSGSLSTGPHLHYEVRHNGIALNPRNFIFDDVKIFELAQNLKKE